MGLFTEEVSEEKLKQLKEKREALSKELELRKAIEEQERLLDQEERKIRELKTPKWIKKLR